VGAGSPKGERRGKELDEPGPTLKCYHDKNPKLLSSPKGISSVHPTLARTPFH